MGCEMQKAEGMDKPAMSRTAQTAVQALNHFFDAGYESLSTHHGMHVHEAVDQHVGKLVPSSSDELVVD
jgi:hypothetical protein